MVLSDVLVVSHGMSKDACSWNTPLSRFGQRYYTKTVKDALIQFQDNVTNAFQFQDNTFVLLFVLTSYVTCFLLLFVFCVGAECQPCPCWVSSGTCAKTWFQQNGIELRLGYTLIKFTYPNGKIKMYKTIKIHKKEIFCTAIIFVFAVFGAENSFFRNSVFRDFVISGSRHLWRRKLQNHEKRNC